MTTTNRSKLIRQAQAYSRAVAAGLAKSGEAYPSVASNRALTKIAWTISSEPDAEVREDLVWAAIGTITNNLAELL